MMMMGNKQNTLKFNKNIMFELIGDFNNIMVQFIHLHDERWTQLWHLDNVKIMSDVVMSYNSHFYFT